MAETIDLEQAVKSARQAAVMCAFILFVFMALLLIDHQARKRFVASLAGINQAGQEFAKAVADAATAARQGPDSPGDPAQPREPGGNSVDRVDSAPAGGAADVPPVNGQRGSQVASPRKPAARVPRDG